MNIKEVTRIYIIESPSQADLLHERKEGLALSESLNLAGIKNQYYQVIDSESFSSCLQTITEIENTKYKKNGFITLHFSMHGNESGIELSSREFITWEQLYRDYLKIIISSIGYKKSGNGNLVAPFHFHFSTCKGYFAKVIKEMEENSPYISLVGPAKEVDWSDSLLAFITLYHNTIHKINGPRIAVQKMNQAADLSEVFHVDLAKNFKFSK